MHAGIGIDLHFGARQASNLFLNSLPRALKILGCLGKEKKKNLHRVYFSIKYFCSSKLPSLSLSLHSGQGSSHIRMGVFLCTTLSYSHLPPLLIWCPTCWVALNDWLVVHLEGGIATTACEAHHMVFPISHWDGRFIDGDVISPNIEYDSYFSLFLRNNKQLKIL